MEKRLSQRNSGKLIAAAVASVGLAGFAASQADASLVVDLRAVSLSAGSGGTIAPGGKGVSLANTTNGATVTIGIYARVSGTNANQIVEDPNGDGSLLVTHNDETFQTLVGAFNSVGGLKGNMGANAAGNNTVYNPTFAPFNGSGETNGAFADFDSDGDLDLGATGTDPTNMWACRTAQPATGAVASDGTKGFWNGSYVPQAQDTVIDPTTMEVRVGTIRFIATGGSGEADINFISRANAEAASLWFEDGIATGKNATNSPFATGAPVAITIVPEPATLGLLGIASLGLLARRRNRQQA